MIFRVLLVISISTLTFSKESMQELYMKNGCSACHGIYAEGIGATPRLIGRDANVLKERLRDLKKGKTRSAFGTVMVSFAKGLSDEQIDQMAEYLSTLKKVPPEEKYELLPDEDDGSS